MIDLVLILSRIQFALTIAFHFLFVPLTIGLILLVAVFEAIHFFKKDPAYRKLSDFWSDLFTINFAVGIVTGLVMSVQFGTNWAPYSVFMGDVFGSPLALEALLAFFLESTFAGIWIFKRKTMGRGFRLAVVALVAVGTLVSALWIITANGFMQHPVGYELAADKAKVLMVDFGALVANPYSLYMLAHTLLAAFLLGAFFVLAVSAYHLKRKSQVDFFKKSVRIAVVVGLVAAVLLPIEGTFYERYVGRNDVQPLKGAILRDKVGELLGDADDEATGKEGDIDANSSATLESAGDALKDLEGLPPTKAVYLVFLLMQGIGFFLIAYLALVLFFRKLFVGNRIVQSVAIWTVPLPYLAITAGWFVAEVGRQPWIVYNLMKVSESVSEVPAANVWFSLFALVAFYAVLFVLDFYLLKKRAQQGPEPKEATPHAA